MTNPTQAFSQEIEDVFRVTEQFQSYVSKPEITDLLPNFLVKGSKNVLIDYAKRIVSRNGFTLYNQVNTGKGAIKGSYEWETSTGSSFSLRAYDHILEFDWNSTYNTLLSNLRTPFIEFAKVLDYNEQQDVLLFVNGDGAQLNRWSGGVSLVRDAPTTSSLRKQGVITAQNTIAFIVGNGSTVAATITDSATNFLKAGFAAGDILNVSGSVSNNSNFTIGSVTAGTITLIMSDVLVNEAAGATVTIYNQTGPTWKSARFFSTITGRKFTYNGIDYFYAGGENTDTLTVVGLANGSSLGSATISHATPAVIHRVAHGLIAGDVVTFTTTGTLPAGISVNTPYYVIAAGLGADDFEISSTSGGAAINTTSDGSGTHTLFKATPNLTVSIGDHVSQTPDIITLPTDITSPFPNFYPDLIGVQLNMVFLASTKSVMVFCSANNDYTDYNLDSPRAPGDPIQQPLTSGPAKCIVPVDTDSMTLNVQNTLIIGSGIDAFDQLDFRMSADNTQELLRIIRYKTAKGKGLISKNAICPIVNNTIYISNEPALEGLSRSQLEAPDGRKNVPLSDPIKDDFDAYDFTNAHVVYWKRGVYIALPKSGIVLIYDLMRNLWQPPQTIPIGRFAIINGQLYGHSSVTNETYKLFTGTNDNGIFIDQRARFAYNNGGTRDRLKNMTEYWSDGYITPNGTLNMNTYFGFGGSVGVQQKTISGNDQSIVTTVDADPLGSDPLGSTPLGGASSNTTPTLQNSGTSLVRFWQIDTLQMEDYIEHFVEYSMQTLDGQFAIVAHGSNQFDAGTSPVSHKK